MVYSAPDNNCNVCQTDFIFFKEGKPRSKLSLPEGCTMDFVQEDGETPDSAQTRDGIWYNTHTRGENRQLGCPVTLWGQLSQGHWAGPFKHWLKQILVFLSHWQSLYQQQLNGSHFNNLPEHLGSCE